MDVEQSFDISISNSTIFDLSFESHVPYQTTDDLIDKQCSPKTQITKNMVSHCIRSNQSYKSLESMAKIINSTSKISVPDTKYRIKKIIDPFLKPVFHILCDSCKIYSATTTIHANCSLCSKLLKRVNSKYFVNLPLKPQLIKAIDDHFETILAYDQKFNGAMDVIRDVQDGLEYKRVKQKYSDFIILSLSVNTDGARIFGSSNKSLWPIQLYLNFLPPNIRFMPDNIIMAAIHEGNTTLINSS